jgi:hypothetical protein
MVTSSKMRTEAKISITTGPILDWVWLFPRSILSENRRNKLWGIKCHAGLEKPAPPRPSTLLRVVSLSNDDAGVSSFYFWIALMVARDGLNKGTACPAPRSGRGQAWPE